MTCNFIALKDKDGSTEWFYGYTGLLIYLCKIQCLQKEAVFIILSAVFIIEPHRDKTNKNGMCAQQRLRSALASAQSDQSLRCPLEESWDP